jgi:hypothetical protein
MLQDLLYLPIGCFHISISVEVDIREKGQVQVHIFPEFSSMICISSKPLNFLLSFCLLTSNTWFRLAHHHPLAVGSSAQPWPWCTPFPVFQVSYFLFGYNWLICPMGGYLVSVKIWFIVRIKLRMRCQRSQSEQSLRHWCFLLLGFVEHWCLFILSMPH